MAGGGYDTLTALPNSDVDIENGTVLDLGGDSVTVASLTLNGSIVNGANYGHSTLVGSGYIGAVFTSTTTEVSQDGVLAIATAYCNPGTLTLEDGSTLQALTSVVFAAASTINVPDWATFDTQGYTVFIAGPVTGGGSIDVIDGAVYYDGWALAKDDSGTINLYDYATFTNDGTAVIGTSLNVIGAYAAYNDYGTTELWPN